VVAAQALPRGVGNLDRDCGCYWGGVLGFDAMKKRSTETEHRELRRRFADLQDDSIELRRERDLYRARATKAEQDCAEWKKRFDEALLRIPKASE